MQHLDDLKFISHDEEMISNLTRDGAYSEPYAIKLAAECFRRSVHLYHQNFPGIEYEVFDPELAPAQGEPLRILFKG
jgi:hypothetical protein